MLEEHTRHLIAARLAAQQTMQAGERTVRTELTNVPPHMQPQSLDMHSIDEVLGVAQKQQSDLVTKVTTLQQFVEQLSAMAASDEPIVYLPPSNTPIDINVVRTECETMARQLREAAIELHDSSNVIGALQRAKTALQMLDGSAVASLQAQQAVEIAELNLQLEQEYVVAARLAAEGTLAKQHAVDSQAQVAYQREYASWQTAQTAFQAKLDKQIEAELRKLLLETQMTPSVAPAVAKPAAAVAMWHEASAVPAARAATERPAVARQPWRQEVTPAAPVAPEREPRSLEEMPELAVVECPICRRQFFARDLEVHTNVCIDRVHGLVQERPQDDADSDMLQAALQRSMEDQGALGNFEASRVSGGGAGSGGGGGGESDDVTSLLAQMFPTLPSQIIAMVWNSVHGDFDLAVSTLGPMQSDPEILQFNKKGGAKQGGRGFGGAKGSSSSSSASSSRGGRR
jgi:hypothetical protein